MTKLSRSTLRFLILILAHSVIAQEPAADDPALLSTARVVNIYLDATNLYWNTNLVSMEQLSHRLTYSTNRIDTIALHTNPDTLDKTPPLFWRLIAQKAVPVLLVEDDQKKPVMEARDSWHRVNIGLDAEKLQTVADLYNTMGYGKMSASNAPSVKTSFELNEGDETYRFQRIELGLQGRGIWLMHERTGDEESNTGIQIKRAW